MAVFMEAQRSQMQTKWAGRIVETHRNFQSAPIGLRQTVNTTQHNTTQHNTTQHHVSISHKAHSEYFLSCRFCSNWLGPARLSAPPAELTRLSL